MRSEYLITTKKNILTPREEEVLKLLICCLTNKEIAKILCIQPSTVKAHVSSIIQKIGAKNRTEAALIGASKGYANPRQGSKQP